jgi:MIP family channel proteins
VRLLRVSGLSKLEVPAPPLLRRAAAEAIAAFFLVFAGCGAIVTNATQGNQLGPVGISIVFGLIIMAMIYAIGHLSGAHINPAVTLAFWAIRHFPAKDAAAYVCAQMVGAIGAALTLLAVWPAKPAALGATVPHVGTGAALLYETLLTAILMFVIIAVATDSRAGGATAALAIGGAVGLGALFGGQITGASMNPARSLGPALVVGEWHDFWIYVAGPVLGALLGATAYLLIRMPQTPPGRRLA